VGAVPFALCAVGAMCALCETFDLRAFLASIFHFLPVGGTFAP